MVREIFDLPAPDVVDRTLPKGLAEQVAGSYLIGCNRLVVRHLESGRLVLESTELPDYHLMYQGDGRFVADEDHAVHLSFQVSGKHARSFVMSNHGADSVAVRMED